MKRFATILGVVLWVLVSATPAQAQKGLQVKGLIVDEEAQPMMAATVVLLQPQDSVMVSYAISTSSGLFAMAKVPAGEYILQMAFIGYQDISQSISIPEDKEMIDLGVFVMKEKTQQLGEVLVTADHIPLLINGDTVDYNARAFATETNAVVEDLLRQLPGVEVEADGTIKAHGEDVDRVLVDGKEFFGDDPTIATRNLPADAIERVKVYDGGSDQAQFTGVDDGERIKTIDLQLREDKKNGVFGKVGAGYGIPNVYTANASVNHFGNGTQLSFLGASNNRNRPAFSFNDYLSFSGGMGSLMNGGSVPLGSGGIMGGRNQSGITTSHAAGLNFNHEFSEYFDLQSSYFFNGAGNVLEGKTLRQTLLTNNTLATETGVNRTSDQYNHQGKVRLEWERPEMSSLIFTARGEIGTSEGQSENNAETKRPSGEVLNSQMRTNSSLRQNQIINTALTYRQLFNKPGRFLTLNGSANLNTSAIGSQVFSETIFDKDPTTREVLNQRQAEDQRNLSYGVNVSYTEPLGHQNHLETSYRRSFAEESFNKSFYDRNGENEVLNTDLSNTFTKQWITDQLGVSMVMNGSDFNLTTGVSFQSSLLTGIVASDVPQKRQFFTWLPRLSGEYEFTTSRSIRLEYQTTLREPSLRQLQPVINNSNPLVTVTGNPDLRPEYEHLVNLGFNSFSQLNFTSFFMSAYGTYTQNKITKTQAIDDQFRQVVRPENTGDAFNVGTYLGGSVLFRAIKTSIRINGNWNYGQQQQWVNGVENLTGRNTGSIQLSLDNKKKAVLDWRVGVRYNLTDVQYSELKELNQQYSQLTYYTNIRVPIGDRLKVNTSFDYQQYLGQAFGGTQTVPLWNASISRTFGANERLELKVTAFDILNQNVGISRSANLNFIEDVQYNALSQYFMLTATWSINRFGKQPGLISIGGSESVL